MTGRDREEDALRDSFARLSMAFQGFEASRGACGTLKYRWQPPSTFDLDCKACHRAGGVNPGDYGRILRIDLDKHDRRIFTPTP